MKGSWGILGGAFDPIHLGHIHIAVEVRQKKQLDGILLVPSLRPPHKQDRCVAGFEHRVRMAELAVAEHSDLRVSRIEEEIEGPGYTLSLMRRIKESFPGAKFSFIVGMDIIYEFETWYQPEAVLDEMTIIVGSRNVIEAAQANNSLKDRFEFVETSLVELSSSEIRDRVRSGISDEKLAGMVGPAVAAYIKQEQLYH